MSTILIALATFVEVQFDYGSTQWWHIPLYILVAVASERGWEYRAMAFDHEQRMRTWRKDEVRGKVDDAFYRYMANRDGGDGYGKGPKRPQRKPPSPPKSEANRPIL